MRRLILTLAIAAALTVPTPAHAKDTTTCSFQTVEAGIWTPYENELTIRCFARAMGVSETTAVYVARRESGLNEWAYNSSGCGGLFQHMLRYWPSRVATYDALLDRYDVHDRAWSSPRANALVAMAMARSGWGPWSL